MGGRSQGGTGLREGASGGNRGVGNAQDIFRERGLDPATCSITSVREPKDYATFEALRLGRDDDDVGSGPRRRLAFHEADSFAAS